MGKTAVLGTKNRETKKVKAEVIDNITLHGFINENVETGSTVYTDDFRSYETLDDGYDVCHSVGEYVDGQIHVYGMDILVYVKKSTQGNLPQNVKEASRSICAGVYWQTQYP